ncbi:MAG TPA: ORF6N domain-containing protein [Verrucomicrobiota bacterium]|nr:ORF6N domain-containing protein [Verrucomicrobiota bacterium]
MANETTYAPVRRIEDLIFLIRGQRVMLDSDLAKIYGVTTGQLNQAVKRNGARFKNGFAFQLAPQELARLISQSVISKPRRGGRTKLPWVFTEHGALMLGNVLNSKVAVEASIRVVQVFISMREQLAAHKELAGKLAELEGRIAGHDEAIQDLFEAVRQLVEPPLPENRPKIGFHMHERGVPYRVKSKLTR